jgi:hypothetical protein
MGTLFSKRPKEYADGMEELRAWLKSHHISQKRVDAVLKKSGVANLSQLALWLRLQLPPLIYANKASLREHMRKDFGVWNWRADKMIRQLHIHSEHLHAHAYPLCPTYGMATVACIHARWLIMR